MMPLHPGTLVIPSGTLQHVATKIRVVFRETIKLFRETSDLERAIIRQIPSTIEEKYLRALRSRVFNIISRSVPQIPDFVFNIYGFVEPEELAEKESEVKTLSIIPKNQLLIYSMNSKTCKLSVELLKSFFNEQMLNSVFEILCRTNVHRAHTDITSHI